MKIYCDITIPWWFVGTDPSLGTGSSHSTCDSWWGSSPTFVLCVVTCTRPWFLLVPLGCAPSFIISLKSVIEGVVCWAWLGKRIRICFSFCFLLLVALASTSLSQRWQKYGERSDLELFLAELWAAPLTSCSSVANICWVVPTDRSFIDLTFYLFLCKGAHSAF